MHVGEDPIQPIMNNQLCMNFLGSHHQPALDQAHLILRFRSPDD